MAKGDITWYNDVFVDLAAGDLDWDADTFKLAAMAAGYTPDRDAHSVWADISAGEATGTGYTAGGSTLLTKTNVVDDINDRGTVDAGDVTFAGIDVGAVSYWVLYDATTGRLVFAIEDGTVTNGSAYSIVWPAAGMIHVHAA